jgi:hypothetical protein
MSPIVSNYPERHGKPKGGPDRYLHETYYDGFTGESSFSWAKEYRVLLFRALIDVIKEHGLGEGGWKSIRWEVYDKVRPILIDLHTGVSLLSW